MFYSIFFSSQAVPLKPSQRCFPSLLKPCVLCDSNIFPVMVEDNNQELCNKSAFFVYHNDGGAQWSLVGEKNALFISFVAHLFGTHSAAVSK